jgi:hypothetical protein
LQFRRPEEARPEEESKRRRIKKEDKLMELTREFELSQKALEKVPAIRSSSYPRLFLEKVLQE